MRTVRSIFGIGSVFLFFGFLLLFFFGQSVVADVSRSVKPITAEGAVVLGGEGRNVYAVSDSVSVTSPVVGDVYSVAVSLLVSDSVSGDVSFLGESAVVSGAVAGDVRMVGGQLAVQSTVSGEVVFFGSEIHLSKDSHVQGDLIVFADTAVLEGVVDGTVWFEGSTISVRGQVGGDLSAGVSSGIVLHSDAVVVGDLQYESSDVEVLEIASGAEVRGETVFSESSSGSSSATISIFMFLLVGGLLSYFLLRDRWDRYLRLPIKTAVLDVCIGLVASVASAILGLVILLVPGFFVVGIVLLLSILLLFLCGSLVTPVIFGSAAHLVYGKRLVVTFQSVMVGVGLLFVLSFIPMVFGVVLLSCILFFVGTVFRRLYLRRFGRRG